MSEPRGTAIVSLLRDQSAELLDHWMSEQLGAPTLRRDLLSESELRQQSREFLDLFRGAVQADGSGDIQTPAWSPVREFLSDLCRTRATQGFTPIETATFIFSLKHSLFTRLRSSLGDDADRLFEEIWTVSTLLDQLGLFTMEVHQRTREAIISRQQQELIELSTPVVKLWDGILAVPLIGTLDSARTQVVMENLLGKIVETGAGIAIIDITGVPTVDTLVAQHLIKTVAAARLMGAECIISGIRPQIAQTIVHLGVVLENVVTKATLADAISLAFQRLDLSIVRGPRRV